MNDSFNREHYFSDVPCYFNAQIKTSRIDVWALKKLAHGLLPILVLLVSRAKHHRWEVRYSCTKFRSNLFSILDQVSRSLSERRGRSRQYV